MATKQPEHPYIPSAGINPDANSLTVQSREAVLVENFRFTGKGVETREGTYQLPIYTQSLFPILHFQSFLNPNGTEDLFAFTKDAIYRKETLASTGADSYTWAHAEPIIQVDTCESATGWTNGALYGKPLSQGSDAVHAATPLAPPGTYPWYDTLYSKTYNLNRASHIEFTLLPIHNFTWDVGTGGGITPVDPIYVDRAFATITMTYAIQFIGASGSDTITIADTITTNKSDMPILGHNKVWRHKFTGLTGNLTGIDVKVISCDIVYADGHVAPISDIVELDCVIDNILMYTPNGDVEFWHSTEYIDKVGATVIAAGSKPPNPFAAEDDNGARLLKYYNPSTGVFEDLTLYEELMVYSEPTSASCPASTGLVSDTTGFAQMSSGNILLNAVFWTDVDGKIAETTKDTYQVGGVEYFYIKDTNRVVSSIRTSDLTKNYCKVLHEGAGSPAGQWQLDFVVGGTYTGVIHVDYVYKSQQTYQPRFVWNFHNRLLMGNTIEVNEYYPWRVRWSFPGDMSRCPSTAFWDLLDTDVSAIRGGIFQRDTLIIYKERSLIRGGTTSSGAPIFQTVNDVGIWGMRTMQNLGNLHFYLGADDVYMWDGNITRSVTRSPNPEGSINSYRVRDYLFSAINGQRINSCFASANSPKKEYWLWLTVANDEFPTQVFVYNAIYDTWTMFKFQPTHCVIEAQLGARGTTFQELVGTFAEMAGTLGDMNVPVTALTRLMSMDSDVQILSGKINTDSGYLNASGVWVAGTSIASWLITRDFIWGDLSRKDRCTLVELELTGDSVELGVLDTYSTSPVDFVQKQQVMIQSRRRPISYYPDLVGKHHRFCLTFNASAKINWVLPYAIVKKEI